MELYAGTGGYSNEDWRGIFYPEELKPREFLSVYAEHFNATELNSSFYAIPGEKAFAGMLKNSHNRVRFAVKVHQSMTHERKATPDDYERLFASVTPLKEAGMLGPFLAQFPYSFHRTKENRLYLKALAERFTAANMPLALEFRAGDWHLPEVIAAVKASGHIWVSVDYPPLPKLPPATLQLTADVAYIRLHGRNQKTWFTGKSAAERHDYLYSREELAPWVAQILEADVRECYLFFLNTTKGHALKNLAMLAELLEEAGAESPISL